MDIFKTLAPAASRQNFDPIQRLASPPQEPDALAKGAESFVDILSKGEDAARGAMTGTVDPHALVEALASSQLAVETVVTVRDRVVEAYQEILRMPV